MKYNNMQNKACIQAIYVNAFYMMVTPHDIKWVNELKCFQPFFKTTGNQHKHKENISKDLAHV